MTCKYYFQGAMTIDGRPPGGVSKKRYWKSLAHLLDHENFHHREDVKALKADVKKKSKLIEELLQVVDSFHGRVKKPKEEHY